MIINLVFRKRQQRKKTIDACAKIDFDVNVSTKGALAWFYVHLDCAYLWIGFERHVGCSAEILPADVS
jgi:hypothetical protein